MSPLVKTKSQVFKGLVEQRNVVFNSFVYPFVPKKPNLHTNSSNKLHFCSTLSEFENLLLCERILINITTCQNETSS
jgi:hypothetical protein